jgi:antirestriction protein ArdC
MSSPERGGGQARIYELVTAKITAQLEAGTVPWQQGWANGGLPRSMATRKPYRGINAFLLAFSGYRSAWWGTYDNIASLGGQVRAKQRGTIVILWKRIRVPDQDSADPGATKIIPMLRYYKVFNADQADGLPERFYPQDGDAPAEVASAEVVMKDYLSREGGPGLTWGGSRAFYLPGTDTITLPARESFKDESYLYGTVFHEMTHSTGHESRLNRPGVAEFDHFGSARYGKEELCAEMGAAFLAAMTGTDQHFDNSAAYLASWLRTIKGDPKLVVQAAAQAQHAVDHILGVTYENGDES